MLRRGLIIIALLVLPTVALAADASDLGPTPTTPAAGTQTPSDSLQPNTAQNLQATPDPQSQSLSAPSLNTLQNTQDKLTVENYLQGEVDNSSSDDSDGNLISLVTLISLASLIGLFIIYYALAVRRLEKRYVPHHKLAKAKRHHR